MQFELFFSFFATIILFCASLVHLLKINLMLKIKPKLYSVLVCMAVLLVLPLRSYSQRYTISGHVVESEGKETIPGVNIFLKGTSSGTTTNNYGFYSFSPMKDTVEIVYSFIGYAPNTVRFYLSRDTVLNITLMPITLEKVVVTAESNTPVSTENRMSVVSMPIRQIQEIPALLGEKDVFKVLQLMPGVQSGGEGSSGLYVRGGGPDQNLIILDDAPVYNAFHLFGFFSLFNGDALKSVELTKGGFPARFGGRLSSVVEMQMKDGSRKDYHAEAGIGLISSRLMVEGPIIKDKASFIVSGRRTYIDQLIKPFFPEGMQMGYFFYDLNAKLNYEINRKNRIYLSGYFGRDKFFVGEQTGQDEFDVGLYWQNATGTVRWNHIVNPKLFSNTSLIYSTYLFKIYMQEKEQSKIQYDLSYTSDIEDVGVKNDWEYRPNPAHIIRFGLGVTYHTFKPSAFVLKDMNLNEYKFKVKSIYAYESGIYGEDEIRIGDRCKANGGLRVSHFYINGKNYINPEPRLMASYMLREDMSVKGSFTMMTQYVHLISSTGATLPTDLWVPTTENIAPQRSKQVALGIAKDILSRGLNFSLEGYYKYSENVLGYKDGASFLLIDDPDPNADFDWESSVTQGEGWSYGLEMLIQRKYGSFSGWIGYTLSWTQLRFDEVNNGEKFYAKYDRRHDISVVGVYRINKAFTVSGTWVYGTGNAISLPYATYPVFTHEPNSSPFPWMYEVASYGGKNEQRMEPYHRLDLGIQHHKIGSWAERTIEFSIYNMYNRKNPYFYFIDQDYDEVTQQTKNVLKKIYLFPIIPSISLTVKF
jgi:hypothetical protein